MDAKKDFKCVRCGNACRLFVKLSDKDIENIEKLGHKRDEFADPDPFFPEMGKFALKHKEDGYCIFSFKEGDKFSCKVYGNHPEICRKFPFFEDGVRPCSALK